MHLKKKTISEAWTAALESISKNGIAFSDHDDRTCLEVLNMSMTMTNFEDTKTPMEMLRTHFHWVYPEIEELEQSILGQEKFLDHERTYGHRIFNYQNALDQLKDYVIPLLQKNPDSRRAIIVTYDPAMDSSVEDKTPLSLTFIFFKIQEGKLHVSYFIRSCDMLIGWPANVYQIGVLQKFVCEQLKLEAGPVTCFAGSAHIYQENLEMVEKLVVQTRKK